MLDRPNADAAGRISAFVYGNILCLAAVVVLTPEEMHSWHGWVYVLGTGASTYLAHVVAALVAHRVTEGRPVSPSEVLDETKRAWPIAASTFVPVVILVAAALSMIAPTHAWVAAQAVIMIQLASLGLWVARAAGERPRIGLFLPGIALAFVGALVALAKAMLTHSFSVF